MYTSISEFVKKRRGCPRLLRPKEECIRVEAQMNFIFSCIGGNRPATWPTLAKFAIVIDFVIFGAIPFAGRVHAQSAGNAVSEFKRNSEDLSAARLSGRDENETQMEKALAYLDSIAVSFLNVPEGPNLDGANRGLSGLASRTPPVGENYRLVKLGGAPAAYAMVINFGLGGPAAVRIYAGGAGHYAFVARIDRFVQKDFFDSDLELVPVSSSEPVFVTISGRTDDLSTGMFSAWRLEGHRVVALWTSDLLQQSSYEADENGFRLAYCSQEDEDHPSQCLKMSRDLYRLQAGEWKRIETADLPLPKPATK
jgi:hypothetical protein